MRLPVELRLISFLLFFSLLICLPSVGQIVNNEVISDTASGTFLDTASYSLVIADIAITGYKQTKPYIIEREIPFKRNAEIKRAELPGLIELCRQQLMNTSLFVDVEVKPTFITRDIVLIDVKVKERWYLFPLPYFKMIDRNFNTWWVEHKRSLQRINYGLKFMHNNVSGRNDKLNFWLVGGYTQQASIRYENPFLDKSLKHGMNVGFSFSRNREINYGTSLNKQSFFKNENDFLIKQIHFDLTYSYRPAVKTRHYFSVSYNDLQIQDTVLKLNPSFFPSAQRRVRYPDMSYNIQYYNVDYIPYPLKGVFADAHIYKRFGNQNNIWQIGGKGTYSMQLKPSSYLQFQASGLIRFPFKQPYFNTRMFGTSDLYLRGMEYYVIDGVAGGVVRGTAIQRALKFNLPMPVKTKLVDKIPVQIFLKAYSDLGYSYNPNPGNSMLNNKLLRAWGFGVDIVTIYDIVLKLEYSFNQLGDKGFYVHSKSDF